MPLPDVTLTIQDGALGLAPPSSSNITALIGVSSLGNVGEVLSFGAGNPQAIKDALGTGPLVEAAALLSQAGCEVVTCKATGTAGSNGAVAKLGTGTSVVTLTGTPLDTFELVVKVITPAAAVNSGLGQIAVSLDGGRNYFSPVSVPVATTYPVPNTGITLNFAAGTLVVNDTYSAALTGPSYDNTALAAALDALGADPRQWFQVYLTGVPADVTATQGVFAAVETKMLGFESQKRFAFAHFNAPNLADATLFAGLASLNGLRTGIDVGFERLSSPLNGQSVLRPCGYSVAKRYAKSLPSESAGKVALGSLGAEIISITRDERVTPGADAINLTSVRTIIGQPGFYATNGRIKAAGISDYQFVELRRVMDIACAAANIGFLRFLNDTVLVSASTGKILETEAQRIETYVNNIVRDAVVRVGYASDANVVVNRSVNILSTSQLLAQVRIVPLGYMRFIGVTIGYFNPALAPQ